MMLHLENALELNVTELKQSLNCELCQVGLGTSTNFGKKCLVLLRALAWQKIFGTKTKSEL